MGFAMRMNFVDVVVSDSLKHYYVDGKKMGYQFDIRLSYYRGHFLSVIDEFKVKVDDFEVPAERIKFCINGKEFSPVEFDKCYTEFWQVIEPATIKVIYPEDFRRASIRLMLRCFSDPHICRSDRITDTCR